MYGTSQSRSINDGRPDGPRRYSLKTVIALSLAFSVVSVTGAVGASMHFSSSGGGPGRANLTCRGGISSLSHVLTTDASIFPGDPETEIETVFTVAEDFFLLERVSLSTHTGTHLDAPAHFIEGGRSVDEMDASEFVFPAYIIDVRARMAAEGPDFVLTVDDVVEYERRNGSIRDDSLVIIRTGRAEDFATPAYADNAPGFSGDAVQWLFDERSISGVGSDSYGPDATIDEDFSATYTALANDGISIPGLTNLDSMNLRGDLIIAPPVRLDSGSGYQVNPLACHSR